MQDKIRTIYNLRNLRTRKDDETDDGKHHQMIKKIPMSYFSEKVKL